jgi:hypothetical protein
MHAAVVVLLSVQDHKVKGSAHAIVHPLGGRESEQCCLDCHAYCGGAPV